MTGLTSWFYRYGKLKKRGQHSPTEAGPGKLYQACGDDDFRGSDSRELFFFFFFDLVFLLVIAGFRIFRFSLTKQKGYYTFCNATVGLVWICLLFEFDSYSLVYPLHFPRSLVWFKCNQLWIPMWRLWEALHGSLPDLECRWLSDSPCIHSHRSRLISSLKLACSIAWFVKGDSEKILIGTPQITQLI